MSKFSRQAKCLLVLLLLCLSGQLQAATYHVDRGGNNSNTGLSLAQAWKTIPKACSTAVAGDTVFIYPGFYPSTEYTVTDQLFYNNADEAYRQILVPLNSGTAEAPIVFRNAPGQARPYIQGDNVNANATYYPSAFNVVTCNLGIGSGSGNVDYIHIDSLHMAMSNMGHVLAHGNGLEIKNCRFDSLWHPDTDGLDNSGAICNFRAEEHPDTRGDNMLIMGNEISNCGNLDHSWGYFNGSGMNFFQGEGIRIINNRIHDCSGYGIKYKGEPTNGPHDAWIEGNWVWDCGYGINYGNCGEAMDSIVVRYNVIWNCPRDATGDIRNSFAIGGCAACNQSLANTSVWVYNNTIDLNSSADFLAGFMPDQFGGGMEGRFFNNIIWDRGSSTYLKSISITTNVAFADLWIDYNYWVTANPTTRSYAARYNYDGESQVQSYTFLQWQGASISGISGYDAHSVATSTNPFVDGVNHDYRLAEGSAAATAGRGGVWPSYVGAFAPTEEHSPNWHDIDQIWHDTYGGLVNAANGFAAGDTLNLIENIYCRNKKWGLIIQVPVLVLGNGYALHPDSVVLNTIANNSFETPDTDPTRAANWDFSGAANITRQFGHWHVVTEGSDEPSLWDGDYALRVQLPCATQTVKSSSFYSFAPKTHHAIEMAYLNTADANLRITVGLLNTNGDTAYSAMNITGVMERGSEPVWVHFMTKDTVETYKIFIQMTGGEAAAASDQVFFDHVLHTTFRTFGVAVEPDTCALTVDMMANQRFYNSATGLMETDDGLCYGSTNSNRELWGIGAQAGIGEGTEIRDLRIEPIQPTLYGWGIYGSYTCSDVTIDRCTIKPKGSNPQGVFTWNGIRWNVDSVDIIFPTNPLDYHYTKREAIPSVGINLRADKNSYGYSSRVSYCRIYNYPYQGAYVTTRRDTSADDVLQYPQNIVEGCEFYPKTIITNGFAIEDYGNAASIIRNNKIFGSGQYHGTGIHITTKLADADSLQWSIVEGNVGTVESYPYSQEYSYGLLAYGIQHEGVALCSLRTNYMTALAIDPAAPAVDGIRFTRSGSFKLVMHDNTFRGFSTGNVTGAAAHFYAPNWAFDPASDIFDCYSNDFITNGVALRSVGVNSVGLQFRDCLFDYKDTLTAPNWKKMKSGENAFLPSRDLRFIDNRYGDAEADSAFEQTMMFGAYNYLSTADNGTEWLLSWSTTINSQGAGGPQEGDSVFCISAQGDTLARGATNASGQLITVLDQFRDSAATTTYNQSVDRTNYSPYTIRVRHSGFELEQQVTIDEPTTINFNFSADYSGLFKRKKRILE